MSFVQFVVNIVSYGRSVRNFARPWHIIRLWGVVVVLAGDPWQLGWVVLVIIAEGIIIISININRKR
jgi:hypothetical protein